MWGSYCTDPEVLTVNALVKKIERLSTTSCFSWLDLYFNSETSSLIGWLIYSLVFTCSLCCFSLLSLLIVGTSYIFCPPPHRPCRLWSLQTLMGISVVQPRCSHPLLNLLCRNCWDIFLINKILWYASCLFDPVFRYLSLTCFNSGYLEHECHSFPLLLLREPGAPLSPPGDRPPWGGTLFLRVCRHPLCCQRRTADTIPGGHGWNFGHGAGALSQTDTWLWKRGPGSCHRPKQPSGHAHVAK